MTARAALGRERLRRRAGLGGAEIEVSPSAGEPPRILHRHLQPDRSIGELAIGGLVALAVIAGLAYYSWTRFYGEGISFFGDTGKVDLIFVVLGWLVAAIFLAAIAGFLALLFLRRDLTVAYVVVAGVLTGVVAALISAPIAANLFSGVTGAGTDFLVAAFRQAGSDIQAATFQQGLLSDPIDKLITFFTVYLILNAMARRTKARFPQGERLVEGGDGDDMEMEALA